MQAEVGYTPPPEFQESAEDSLVEIDLNDSTELWLIQLPENHSPDFDGQELSLELHQDGQLGSLEGPSGKFYDIVSYSSQESDETVFVSSPSGPQIAGKIKRHVSLVHYPDPNELKALNTDQKQMLWGSTTLLTNSTHHLSTPSKSMSKRNSHSQSRSRSTHTSKRSTLSDIGDVSKPPKRSAGEPSRYSDHSIRDSGQAQSVATFSGSSGHFHGKKSKRKTDVEA